MVSVYLVYVLSLVLDVFIRMQCNHLLSGHLESHISPICNVISSPGVTSFDLILAVATYIEFPLYPNNIVAANHMPFLLVCSPVIHLKINMLTHDQAVNAVQFHIERIVAGLSGRVGRSSVVVAVVTVTVADGIICINLSELGSLPDLILIHTGMHDHGSAHHNTASVLLILKYL